MRSDRHDLRPILKCYKFGEMHVEILPSDWRSRQVTFKKNMNDSLMAILTCIVAIISMIIIIIIIITRSIWPHHQWWIILQLAMKEKGDSTKSIEFIVIQLFVLLHFPSWFCIYIDRYAHIYIWSLISTLLLQKHWEKIKLILIYC